MKALVMVLLTIFLGKSTCSKQDKKDIENATIEYVANTRGFYQKITIQNKKYTISKDRSGRDNPKEESISDKDWKELLVLFKNLDLDNLENIKAPSEKRFYDGAAIATFTVDYKGKLYKSQNFDHGNPAVQIKGIIEKINSFAHEKDEN